MLSLLKAILRLFGIGNDASTPTTPLEDQECTLPGNIDIPPPVSHDAVPVVTTSAQVAGFAAHAVPAAQASAQVDATAQATGCNLTIRPELGSVNLRLGPGLQFEPPVAKTQGGVRFQLVGASEPDKDDLRWFAIKLGTNSAWIRSDLVKLDANCVNFSFITEEDINATPTPTTTTLFPLPTSDRITQGYRVPAHQGYDMGSKTGTALIAPADGVCIRRIDCTNCTDAQPNKQPNANFQCPSTWKDPKWGFGYGNFIIVRYDYAVLPQATREVMDAKGLTNGFAYVLLAHMSRIDIGLGKQFKKGDSLGATGNTGCSTGAHLHFEAKIGNDENVDGRWQSQKTIHPKVMFQT